MSIKPILFNTEMVRAILDNRKTVTRRLPSVYTMNKWNDYDEYVSAVIIPGSIRLNEKRFYEKYAPYKPGDILWVRETWAEVGGLNPNTGEYYQQYIYRATYKPDGDYDIPSIKWRPSIHMPRAVARIFLRAKSVHVERLKDITDEQAIAEGARYTDFGMYTPRGKMSIDGGRTFYPFKPVHHPGYHFKDVQSPEQCFEYPRFAFANYWGKTIKRADLPFNGWDANPWIYVIEFERIPKPNDF